MKSIYLFLMSFILQVTGCKTKSENIESDSDSDQMENEIDKISESVKEAAENIKDMFEDSDPDQDLKLVEVSELKALLPDELAGMNRERLKGEGVGALGFKMTQAEAEYEKGEKKIELHIIDFGGFGPALFGLASWTLTNVYHENDDGYEKVTEWMGYKAFEKSNRKDKSSAISIIYKNRLIVNAEADGLDIKDLKEMLEDEIMDELDDLEINSPE